VYKKVVKNSTSKINLLFLYWEIWK